MLLRNTTWLSAKSSKGCGNLMFSFNFFWFCLWCIFLKVRATSWTSFIHVYCLQKMKIEMIRTLRLRILLNNKYIFIAEFVCILENTLSSVLGYRPPVVLLTGTRFFSSLQFRLFSADSEKSSMKRRCQHKTFDSITKVKPWQSTFLLGRFFVTSKPFRPFFSLACYSYDLFQLKKVLLLSNASVGKWGRVKIRSRFLGVLFLS